MHHHMEDILQETKQPTKFSKDCFEWVKLAETILVVEGLLHWCGIDSVGSLVDLAWVVGGSLVVFSCARDVGLYFLVLLACPGLWGFACCLC